MRSFEDCFTPTAMDRIRSGAKKAAKHVREMSAHSIEHLTLLEPSTDTAELRIGRSDYTPLATKVLIAGHTLMKQEDGTMRVASYSPLPKQAWGFDAESVARDAKSMQWQDADLLKSL